MARTDSSEAATQLQPEHDPAGEDAQDAVPVGNTRSDKIGALSIAAVLIIVAVYILMETTTYKPGAGGDPGAAALPRLMGIFAILAAVVLIFQTLRSPTRKATSPTRDGFRATGRVVLMMVVVAVGITLLPLLGYFLTMSALLYVSGFMAGAKRWWANLLVALISSWVTLLLFSGIFSVPLPMGPIDHLIGG